MTTKKLTVAITGAGGNLGSKLVTHLRGRDWCGRILALDRRPQPQGLEHAKIEPIVCDVADASDARWHGAAESADAILHFAALNPAPDSNWSEAAGAVDMTMNLLLRAQHHSCRFVFASSNHAMGGYKDVEVPGSGLISGDTPPLPGTRLFNGEEYLSAFAYGSSKLFGERACLAVAAASGGRLTAVSARIGWCMNEPNRPDRIVTSGGARPKSLATASPAQLERDLRWFRNMWLSDRDLLAGYEAAILADASNWPAPAIVVSAVSGNTGTLWDLEGARRFLGHVPQDDVWVELKKLGVG